MVHAGRELHRHISHDHPERHHTIDTNSKLSKTNLHCTTPDGWKLHLVRTYQPGMIGGRKHPILLVPGLGSSGAFSFDLSPAVSLADWLAGQGWDVWIAELRGNGLSDKPSLVAGRSRWWSIDDNVEVDVPAIIDFVCSQTRSSGVHVLGHSMGGMIMTRVLARRDSTAARVRSLVLVGSACFLEGSWWQVLQGVMGAANLLWTVPAGSSLRMYSNLAFTSLGSRYMDMLYFWPPNTDPALARAVLARNFSSISPGVILQLRSAFKSHGLLSTRRMTGPSATGPTPAFRSAAAASTTSSNSISGTSGTSGTSITSSTWPSPPGTTVSTHATASPTTIFSSTTSPTATTTTSSALRRAGPSRQNRRRLRQLFADGASLAAVSTPVMVIVGDRDRMCPPSGCRKTYELFGSPQKLYVEVGPATSGTRMHYGHFDILMGRHVVEEVFPQLGAWFSTHDSITPPPRQEDRDAALPPSNSGRSTHDSITPPAYTALPQQQAGDVALPSSISSSSSKQAVVQEEPAAAAGRPTNATSASSLCPNPTAGFITGFSGPGSATGSVAEAACSPSAAHGHEAWGAGYADVGMPVSAGGGVPQQYMHCTSHMGGDSTDEVHGYALNMLRSRL